MKQSRELIAVGGKLVRAASERSLQTASAKDWRVVVATFIASEDVRESSRSLYTRTLSQFFRWIERTGRNLPELTREDILEYKDSLQEEGLSALTIGSYIVSVRKFYTWAEAMKIYPNIARGVKTPKRKNDFEKAELTNRQSSSLLEYCKNNLSLRDFAIVNLIIRTGLRTIEVVRADIEDLTIKTATDETTGEEISQRVLKIWGKGHDTKDSFVVLSPKAYQPIKDYLSAQRKRANRKEPLFSSDSHRNAGGRLTTRTISKLCKDGLTAIGLSGREFTAHSLRHTTGAAIYRQTNNIEEVQKALRHNSSTTSQIYAKRAIAESRIIHAPELCIDAAF